MKKLHELKKVDPLYADRVVTALCDNSKRIISGCMFVVLSKNEGSRRKHVEEAISCGAKYILQECKNDRVETKNDVLLFFVRNVRAEWARIVSKFYESNFKNMVAITGTNGKSSTIDILRQIWIKSGIKSASIGTLGITTNESSEKLQNNMTTPDCLELHKILWQLCENGIKNIAMEATSQGVEQHRIDVIEFNVCAFTNFTHDHLDYHQTFENYWNAKERLFLELASEHTVFVVNDDDQYTEKIREIARRRNIKCVGYGHNSNDVKIIEIKPKELSQLVRASFYGKEFLFTLPLLGVFQVHNAMCAATIAHFTGLDDEKIFEELAKLRPISGRMELITRFKSAYIYIDYAHTPDALKNAISSLRNHTKSRIITLFGCGGNRDRQKRILMGEVAEKFSDIAIVSDDNPRDEDPEQIRKMILEGCPHAIEIANRKIAIEFAMEMLSDGDTLLVAGKGHEAYQQIGNELSKSDDKMIILEKMKASNDLFQM